MMNHTVGRSWIVSALILFTTWTGQVNGQDRDPAQLAGVHGGLIVQLGASDTQAAAELSLTGRYLIHVLDSDAAKVKAALIRLREDEHYGLAWAEQARNTQRLPYAENLVNLIVVRDYSVPIKELSRVLAPGGSIVVTNDSVLKGPDLEAGGFRSVSKVGSTLVARKPWPKAMDVLSHPWLAADGNAVSQDTLVAPPDRVRWGAAATSEVEGIEWPTAGVDNQRHGPHSRSHCSDHLDSRRSG